MSIYAMEEFYKVGPFIRGAQKILFLKGDGISKIFVYCLTMSFAVNGVSVDAIIVGVLDVLVLSMCLFSLLLCCRALFRAHRLMSVSSIKIVLLEIRIFLLFIRLYFSDDGQFLPFCLQTEVDHQRRALFPQHVVCDDSDQ